MTLAIELSPEKEARLKELAATKGQTPDAFALAAVEARLQSEAGVLVGQKEWNQRAIALLRRWMEEPPDFEEAEGYPLEITPLSLREVQIDWEEAGTPYEAREEEQTMTLEIELSPEREARLRALAAGKGQTPDAFARQAVEEKLAQEDIAGFVETGGDDQMERNQRAIELLRRWSEEDAADPDPDPVPQIAPLSLREVRID